MTAAHCLLYRESNGSSLVSPKEDFVIYLGTAFHSVWTIEELSSKTRFYENLVFNIIVQNYI